MSQLTSSFPSCASSRTDRHLQFCSNGIIPSFWSPPRKGKDGCEARECFSFVLYCYFLQFLFIWLFCQGPRWGVRCWKKWCQNACCIGEHSLAFQRLSLVLVYFPAMKDKLEQAEFRKAFKRVTGERVGKCFNWLLKLPLNCHRAIFSKASFSLAKFIRNVTSAPPLAFCPCPFLPFAVVSPC